MLFDAYGTLLDARGLHEEATRSILASLGLSGLDAREIHASWDEEAAGLVAEGEMTRFLDIMRLSLARCLAKRGVSLSREQLDLAMRILVRTFEERTGLFDDAIDVLAFCRRLGLRTAIISNADAGVLRSVLARTGLDGLVDLVVISDEVGALKPHARIFEAALSGLGVEPGEALMVGDMDVDVLGARRLGMAVALVARDRVPELPPGVVPDFVVSGLRELKSIIAALAGSTGKRR